MEDLSFWADITSLIGFVITIATFVIALWARSEVNKLKESHLFDKRMPEHLKKLTEISKNVSILLMSFSTDNTQTIQTEIQIYLAELQNLIPKLLLKSSRNQIKSIVKKQERKIKDNRIVLSKADYQEIYTEFKEIETQIKNLIEDKKKSLKS